MHRVFSKSICQVQHFTISNHVSCCISHTALLPFMRYKQTLTIRIVATFNSPKKSNWASQQPRSSSDLIYLWTCIRSQGNTSFMTFFAPLSSVIILRFVYPDGFSNVVSGILLCWRIFSPSVANIFFINSLHWALPLLLALSLFSFSPSIVGALVVL